MQTQIQCPMDLNGPLVLSPPQGGLTLEHLVELLQKEGIVKLNERVTQFTFSTSHTSGLTTIFFHTETIK